ncbi:hypothetical protein, partial [Variovorax sp. UMC13]|uniref:hypothetical protein n=1 Tax=Variovorax sp. UMC13 TaxID=1862326 RepID=UPI001C818C47
KPCSLSRFLQNRQTFFAFFFFTVSLRSDSRPPEAQLRFVFSAAFYYDSVFTTSSNLSAFFFAHQSEASQLHPGLLSYMTSAERSPRVYAKAEGLRSARAES